MTKYVKTDTASTPLEEYTFCEFDFKTWVEFYEHAILKAWMEISIPKPQYTEELPRPQGDP